MAEMSEGQARRDEGAARNPQAGTGEDRTAWRPDDAARTDPSSGTIEEAELAAHHGTAGTPSRAIENPVSTDPASGTIEQAEQTAP